MADTPTRDDRILDHIGLYSISLRPVIERLFFEGKNCGNVIQRLTKQGKIVSRPGLPSRIRYYQLATSEAIARSFPQHRTEPLGTQAINKHLAILWYCCLADGVRHRLERGDVKNNVSEHLPPGDYAVEQLEDNHRIVRLRVASSDAEDSSIVRWVRGEVSKAAKHPLLNRLQRSGQVAYTLLADTETRIPSLQRSLDDSGLLEQSTVVLAFAPSPQTLPAALRNL